MAPDDSAAGEGQVLGMEFSCLDPDVVCDRNREFYRRRGYVLAAHALREDLVDALIAGLENQRYMTVADNANMGGVTNFVSKNGDKLLAAAPVIADIERECVAVVQALSGVDYQPLDNREIGVSVNVTPPGGAFDKHFDRHEITAIFYLGAVEGGELCIWPRLGEWEPRWLGGLARRVTWKLTRLIPPVRIAPARGALLFFDSRTPHGVAEVKGPASRISLVFGLDRPGVSFAEGQSYYGYGEETEMVGSLR